MSISGDVRFLSWGVHLEPHQSLDRVRYILFFNIGHCKLLLTNCETQQASRYDFSCVAKCKSSKTDEHLLVLDLDNIAVSYTVHLYLDSEFDRDCCHKLLMAIMYNTIIAVAPKIGLTADLEIGAQVQVMQRRPIDADNNDGDGHAMVVSEWMPRIVVITQNRILLFHDKKRVQPLTMLSLNEASFRYYKSELYDDTVQIWFGTRKMYQLHLGDRTAVRAVNNQIRTALSCYNQYGLNRFYPDRVAPARLQRLLNVDASDADSSNVSQSLSSEWNHNHKMAVQSSSTEKQRTPGTALHQLPVATSNAEHSVQPIASRKQTVEAVLNAHDYIMEHDYIRSDSGTDFEVDADADADSDDVRHTKPQTVVLDDAFNDHSSLDMKRTLLSKHARHFSNQTECKLEHPATPSNSDDIEQQQQQQECRQVPICIVRNQSRNLSVNETNTGRGVRRKSTKQFDSAEIDGPRETQTIDPAYECEAEDDDNIKLAFSRTKRLRPKLRHRQKQSNTRRVASPKRQSAPVTTGNQRNIVSVRRRVTPKRASEQLPHALTRKRKTKPLRPARIKISDDDDVDGDRDTETVDHRTRTCTQRSASHQEHCMVPARAKPLQALPNTTLPLQYAVSATHYRPRYQLSAAAPREETALSADRLKVQTFVWGKLSADKHATSPFYFDDLCKKEMHLISAAKEGSHCLGVGVRDWCFVWGIGSGLDTRTTVAAKPTLVPSLKRENVTQTCCSAQHSLCLTRTGVVYGWGNKALTLLRMDTNVATPLHYLNGKGVQCLAACNTHSVAHSRTSANLFAFGRPGPWLGFDDEDSKARRTKRTSSSGAIKLEAFVHHALTVSVVDCASHYTLILLSNGCVGACGVNKYGRMGVGSTVHQSSKVLWSPHLHDIVRISAAPMHAGFINAKGRAYTCGKGSDNRLGHGDTADVCTPKPVQSMRNVRVREIVCVAERSYVVGNNGHLFVWGKDPATKQTHFRPFVCRAMGALRVFNVVAAKEFCILQTLPLIRHDEQQDHVDQCQTDEGACNRGKKTTLHHAYRRRTEHCVSMPASKYRQKDHV